MDESPSDFPPHLDGGDLDKFEFKISSIRLQDGASLELPRPGVTAIVGGNNVGKSTVLRQISNWISLPHPTASLEYPGVVTALELQKGGSEADFVAWMRNHGILTHPTGQDFQIHRSMVGNISLQRAVALFLNDAGVDRVADLGRYLVHYADAKARFNWVNPQQRRASITDPSQNPLHQLEDDPAAFAELSRISEEIFGMSLTMDFLGGNIMIRAGIPEVAAPPVDQVTAEYRSALGRLRPLHEQGDGMSSVFGLLIPLVAATHLVMLIDEPEAFLHPPQARALGQTLARITMERGVQLILATHDRNLLTGLLDHPSSRLTVLRVSRDGDVTKGLQLGEEGVRSTWTDPALRHTHVLDGLFHQLVVIAENERDCQFYAAAMEAAHERKPFEIAPHDVLYLSSHGKSGMPRLARILVGTGVRVVATPDLDMLNDKSQLKSLVESLGGEWTDSLENNYERATAEFRAPRQPRLNSDVLGSVTSILNANPGDVYTSDTRQRVTAALSIDSPWRSLKQYGQLAMRADRAAVVALLDELDHLGVVLVRVGELERFGPDVTARKGEGWLHEALASNVHVGPEAAAHINRVLAGSSTDGQ